MDVTIRGLSKRFDREEVLADIDLDLAGGQIVAVIGLNGAGKTTLLRCLAGVIAPTRGSIRWNDCDSLRDDRALHAQMMFLPDAPLLIDQQSVLEHLALHVRAYGRDQSVADTMVVDVLRDLGLLELSEMRLSTLSRGQRYKAALAAMLLIRPELWLLDEPFASGMDPQGILVLKQHARTASAANACVIYTTQIIEIAERFCDLLLVIDRGRISHRLDRQQLKAMPAEGPGSLGDQLAAYRDRR